MNTVALTSTGTQPTRQKRRLSLRTLLLTVAIVGLLFGYIGGEYRNAKREQAAYQELCTLGATGDDWVGWREWFIGRKYAPIVQIGIPPTVSLDTALPLLSSLDNLEALDISGRSIDASQIAQLGQLKSIRSLNLSSTSITDQALPQLAQFTHVRWLYLEDTQITDDGFRQLRNQMPACMIRS